MSDALSRDSKLALIVGLCRELAKLGLNVGMSDARPAAVIRPRICGPLWVTVDDSQSYYEWLEADKRYRTTSPAEAAALIAEAIKAMSSGSDERS